MFTMKTGPFDSNELALQQRLLATLPADVKFDKAGLDLALTLIRDL